MLDECIILFFFVQLAKMSARSKELEAENSRQSARIKELEDMNPEAVIHDLEEKLAKMSARSKKLEAEVSKDLSNVIVSRGG